mgnify:CR=1 FL=1
MTRTYFAFTAIFFAALPFHAAQAQAPENMQPGMWEYQMETQIPGMSMKMPPTTFRRCLTAQDVAQNKQFSGDPGKNPCTFSNFRASGGKTSYEFVCKTDGGTMKGRSSGAVTPTSMDLETRMQMVPPVEGMSEMQQKMKARRVGNC